MTIYPDWSEAEEKIHTNVKWLTKEKGEENMKYIIGMTMKGSFPGSPDYDYYPVDEKTYDKIRKLVFRFGRHDTLESALSIDIKEEKLEEK